MSFIVIAIAFLVSSAYAAKVDLPRPTEADCCDGEASTNEVFAAGSMSGNWFCVMLENAALANSFGNTDQRFELDGNGTARIKKFGFVFECDTNRYCTVWREE